jgi:hypothetical protein
MISDVADLRSDNWQERRKPEGPKTIKEVHRVAVLEREEALEAARKSIMCGRRSLGGPCGGATSQRRPSKICESFLSVDWGLG